MPQWLIGAIAGSGAAIAIVLLATMLLEEIKSYREAKRRLEHDSEKWYTTGSPTQWLGITNELED